MSWHPRFDIIRTLQNLVDIHDIYGRLQTAWRKPSSQIYTEQSTAVNYNFRTSTTRRLPPPPKA